MNIYNLYKVSKHWYHNIIEIVISLRFKENDVDIYIYIYPFFKICVGKFKILVLYYNDVILENIDLSPIKANIVYIF